MFCALTVKPEIYCYVCWFSIFFPPVFVSLVCFDCWDLREQFYLLSFIFPLNAFQTINLNFFNSKFVSRRYSPFQCIVFFSFFFRIILCPHNVTVQKRKWKWIEKCKLIQMWNYRREKNDEVSFSLYIFFHWRSSQSLLFCLKEKKNREKRWIANDGETFLTLPRRYVDCRNDINLWYCSANKKFLGE